MAIDPEDFWRKQINGLGEDLPEDGQKSPEIESIKPKKQVRDGNRKVFVQRIITQVYVMSDIEGKVYAGDVSQKTQILGTMTMAKAIKLSQEDKFS